MHELTIKIIDQVEMILAGAFGAIEKSLWVRTLKPNKKKMPAAYFESPDIDHTECSPVEMR